MGPFVFSRMTLKLFTYSVVFIHVFDGTLFRIVVENHHAINKRMQQPSRTRIERLKT